MPVLGEGAIPSPNRAASILNEKLPGDHSRRCPTFLKEINMQTFKKQPTFFQNTRFRALCVWMVAFLVLGAIFSVPSIQSVQALPPACTTTADGDWSAAIWSCGTPTAADDVVILHQVTLASDVTVASLSVAANLTNQGVLQFTGANTLSLSGNLNVDLGAIIDPGLGTVAFLAGSQVIDTHDQWVDFYNFTKTTTGSLTFSPSTIAGESGGGIHVLETLTLTGTAPATYLTLRSTAAGSKWQVWYEGSAVVDYVDVQDSANVAGAITVVHGINTSNNSGWLFGDSSTTSVTLTSSRKPGLLNQTVTFTATVLPSNAQGTVTFQEDGGGIDTCEDIPVVAGKATCTVTFTKLGFETITAVFNSTDTFADATSNPINQLTVGGLYYLPTTPQ
jgi:hypothetical protein